MLLSCSVLHFKFSVALRIIHFSDLFMGVFSSHAALSSGQLRKICYTVGSQTHVLTCAASDAQRGAPVHLTLPKL